MRQTFAHEAVLIMPPDGDTATPGAAITTALCGHWQHEPPCPLAAHHTRADRTNGEVRLRTLFATEPDLEATVRHRIDAALSRGELTGPDGAMTRWQLIVSRSSDVLAEETDHAERLRNGAGGTDAVAGVDALRDAERRLQRAQLASDVAALDELVDDRLVFTGPDGKLYTKQDDLHVHRSGRQSMTRVDEEDLAVLVVGRTGVTWFLGTLEGTIAGEPFLARVRYTRTWIRDAHQGWRLIAAHVSPADG